MVALSYFVALFAASEATEPRQECKTGCDGSARQFRRRLDGWNHASSPLPSARDNTMRRLRRDEGTSGKSRRLLNSSHDDLKPDIFELLGMQFPPPEGKRASARYQEAADRIVGGSRVPQTEGESYPFFALPWVEYCEKTEFGNWTCANEYFWGNCGASLIEGDFVLTAAHCFYPEGSSPRDRHPVPGGLKFQVGACDDAGEVGLRCGHPSVILTAISFAVHPEFAHVRNGGNLAVFHDVLLFQLEKVVEDISPVNLIAVPSPRREKGSVLAIGMGALSSNSSDTQLPDFLQEGRMNYVLDADCREVYKTRFNNSQWPSGATVCAGGDGDGESAVGTCFGDSGGPLLWRHDSIAAANDEERVSQVGISSWSAGCAEMGFPSVFVNASNYKPWIRDIVCRNTAVHPASTKSSTDLCQTFAPTSAPSKMDTRTEIPTRMPRPSSPTIQQLPTSSPRKQPGNKPTPRAEGSIRPTVSMPEPPTRYPTVAFKIVTFRPTKSPTEKKSGNSFLETASPTFGCFPNLRRKFVRNTDKKPRGRNRRRCGWLDRQTNRKKKQICKRKKTTAKTKCRYICDVGCQVLLYDPPVDDDGPLTRHIRRRD